MGNLNFLALQQPLNLLGLGQVALLDLGVFAGPVVVQIISSNDPARPFVCRHGVRPTCSAVCDKQGYNLTKTFNRTLIVLGNPALGVN